MSGAHSELLNLLESLGDNCELGFYLRENGHETSSFLRWVLCPVDTVIGYVELDAPRAGFAFENLVPSAPGMVRDTSTGFCFHTTMRSTRTSDGFEFEHDEATRLTMYAAEKSKHDHLLQKFESSLASDTPKIYVVKANDELSEENIDRLYTALAAHKQTQNFVLLAIKADVAGAHHTPLHWLNDSVCIAHVDRFANYLTAQDIHTPSWQRVCDELVDAPKIATWLSDKLTAHIEPAQYKGIVWHQSVSKPEKLQIVLETVQSLNSYEELDEFLRFLHSHDKPFALYLGVDIYLDVSAKQQLGDVALHVRKELAASYARLIRCVANFDTRYAQQFHTSTLAMFVQYPKLLKKHQNISKACLW